MRSGRSTTSSGSGTAPELTQRTRNLLVALRFREPDTLIQAAPRPFEAAKAVLSFTRRLRELAALDENGLVRFPTLFDR